MSVFVVQKTIKKIVIHAQSYMLSYMLKVVAIVTFLFKVPFWSILSVPSGPSNYNYAAFG